MDEEYLKLYQKNIMQLRATNRLYLRKIKENDAKIEKLRGYSREIMGREEKC